MTIENLEKDFENEYSQKELPLILKERKDKDFSNKLFMLNNCLEFSKTLSIRNIGAKPSENGEQKLQVFVDGIYNHKKQKLMVTATKELLNRFNDKNQFLSFIRAIDLTTASEELTTLVKLIKLSFNKLDNEEKIISSLSQRTYKNSLLLTTIESHFIELTTLTTDVVVIKGIVAKALQSQLAKKRNKGTLKEYSFSRKFRNSLVNKLLKTEPKTRLRLEEKRINPIFRTYTYKYVQRMVKVDSAKPEREKAIKKYLKAKEDGIDFQLINKLYQEEIGKLFFHHDKKIRMFQENIIKKLIKERKAFKILSTELKEDMNQEINNIFWDLITSTRKKTLPLIRKYNLSN